MTARYVSEKPYEVENINFSLITPNRNPVTTKRLLVASFIALVQVSCVPSEDPKSEELVRTAIPTYTGGLRNVSYTTTTPAFTLAGECDNASRSLEWSYNQSTWTTIAGGCVGSAFSFNIAVSSPRTVYIRARTKYGWTETSIAQVRFVPPPADPAFQVVAASGAMNDDFTTGITFTMSHAFQGNSMSSLQNILTVNITGIVYDQ